MRNLLKFTWLPLLTLFLYSCATTPETDIPVSQESDAVVTEGKAEVKEPVWVTITADEYFVSQETIKYEDGFVDGYRLYEYDNSGHILKKSQIGSDESVISEEIFNYNSDKLLVKSEFYSGGKMISYSEFTYNGNKNLIEEKFFNPKGELFSVSSYEYDEKGRRSKWISGDSGGIPMMYTEYEYKDDQLIRMSYFMPAGDLEGYTQMDYEGDKLLLESTYSAAAKLEKKTEYVYQGGRAEKALFYTGKNLIRTIEYSYDDAGNVIAEKTLNRHGDVIDIVEKEYVVFSVEKTVLQ